MLDIESLARPIVVSDRREESALKYMGTWASTKVNINTAPRHVLEAAFIFGGDADRIADAIIRQRRIKPFENLDELKKSLFGYTDSIGKCEKYITTSSTFFTIRVTAVSGVAKASSVIAITKDGKKVQRIAVMNI
jgi:type II secretory pathway component PulK